MFFKAEAAFARSNIKLTCEGRSYLGAAIGTDSFIQQFVEVKVQCWSSEMSLLAKVAESQPRAAFATFLKAWPVVGFMHLVPHSPDSSNYAASGGCHSPSA